MAETRWWRRMPAPGWLLLALAAGLAVGLALGPGAASAVDGARLVGGLWLDALRMTIVPLVFSLVATGVAALSETMEAGGKVGRRLPVVMLGFLLLSAALTALVAPAMLRLVPLSPEGVAALRAGLAAAPPPPAPGLVEAIRALVPVNPVASAAEGAMVPLVVFALVLGLALGRVEPARAEAVLQPLRGLADAMIVVVGWVLRAAPVGVFALALVIGATAGLEALGALGGYVAIQAAVSLLLALAATLLARWPGGAALLRFARAAAPAQAVAASTQSSIATLPAMLAAAARIGVAEQEAAVALPLSVAVFKVTAPSSALIAGLTLAWVAGAPVGAGQLVVAAALSVVATLAVLGMPGAVSFFTATTPTVAALGGPVALIPVLLAVDTIPDMFRTVANVTADLAVTVIATRRADTGP